MEQLECESVEKYLRDLHNSEAYVRKSAAENLGKSGIAQERVLSVLNNVAAADANRYVRDAAAHAYAELSGRQAPTLSEIENPLNPHMIAGGTDSGFTSARKEASERDMLFGFLWCMGGLIVTVVTHQNAVAQGGGLYYVAWGAMIYGGLQFLKGLVDHARS